MASEMANGTTADIPERTADVIVVGAGIIGCATAYYLAKKGTNAHFILKHSVGNLPNNVEVDGKISDDATATKTAKQTTTRKKTQTNDDDEEFNW